MRFAGALVLAAVTAFSGLALADIPPPLDLYSGPTETSLAGLKFVRERVRHLGPLTVPAAQRHPFGYQNMVLLSDCERTHANCRLAKKQRVLKWAVTAVNGVVVSDDLAAFEAVFRATPAGHKVRLTLQFANDFVDAPTPSKVDISFGRQ